MRADFDGRGLRVLRTEVRTDAYTRQQVTYRSNGTVVSGVLLRPHGRGPFPAVVLNHGYIEPSAYVTGQGMAREQDWLARAGFVVLHTDYRGHAAGDPAGDLERELRLGYTRDSINAVLALERLPYVDADKTAMVGRSMGGGVTLNALVAAPGIVDAAVDLRAASARASSTTCDHFTLPEPARGRARARPTGSAPRSRTPAFYRGLSSRTYFDRITEPVLIHHGTVDGTCPPRWSRTTQRLLERAGVDSTLVEYPGEDHAFYAAVAGLDRSGRCGSCADSSTCDLRHRPGATLATTEHREGHGAQRAADTQAGRGPCLDVVRRARRRRRRRWSARRS